jgi:hypothetical protein
VARPSWCRELIPSRSAAAAWARQRHTNGGPSSNSGRAASRINFLGIKVANFLDNVYNYTSCWAQKRALNLAVNLILSSRHAWAQLVAFKGKAGGGFQSMRPNSLKIGKKILQYRLRTLI